MKSRTGGNCGCLFEMYEYCADARRGCLFDTGSLEMVWMVSWEEGGGCWWMEMMGED
jgi:hypothetical protein